MNLYLPFDYLEEVASDLELPVDYLIEEFVIDDSLVLEMFSVTFPLD